MKIYKFYYSCLDNQGKIIKGEVVGTAISDVRHRLEELGLYPEYIKQKRLVLGETKLKQSDLIFLFRQMAFSLQHGISIVETLELQYQEVHSKKMKMLLEHLLKMIKQGFSLLQSLRLAPFEMPYIVYEWIAIGEELGDLSGSLWSLVDHLKKQEHFIKKIKSQLIYPTIVVTMIFLFFNILLFFFFPFMAEAYEEFQMEIPFLLGLGVQFSYWIKKYWLLHLCLFFSFFCILIYYREKWKEKLVLTIQSILSKVPFLKEIGQLIIFVPFSAFFGELLKSGISINRIFVILSKENNFKYIQSSFFQANDKIKEGYALTTVLEDFSFIPKVALKTLIMAEYSGHLAETFLFLSEYYGSLLSEKITKFIKILEPLLIIILGGFILGLVLVLYLPIIDSYGGMFQF